MFAISITLAVIIVIVRNILRFKFWIFAKIYMVVCTNLKIQFIYKRDVFLSLQYLYYKNTIA